MSELIRDLGEQGLLAKLRPFCSDRLGDDCAVMSATLPGQVMVVTTDILTDQVHFSDITTSPADAGWRAAAANLSDLAAMGATPWGMVMAIALPSDTPVAWIESVYLGFSDCLQQYGQGAELVGGDTVRSPVKTLSVTAFGQVEPNRMIQRHTAQVGDVLLITGWHGLSKAGLELLLDPQLLAKIESLGKVLGKEAIAQLYQAHQRPIPRLDVPNLLKQLGNPVRVSGMDSSDGLADAIMQICQASGVGAKIDWQAIPIHDSLRTLAEPEQVWDWLLYGGEDFELVLSLPLELAELLIAKLRSHSSESAGRGSAIIGEIVAGKSIAGLDRQSGFQHFR